MTSLVRGVVVAVGTVLVAAALPGCTSEASTMPRCGDPVRLAVVAQSVPTASYVPCVRALPTGWRVTDFEVARGGTSFVLLSDRAEGRPVDVRLVERCSPDGASPQPPRASGGRAYLRLRSIAPRYAGHRYDVFAGGCVVARFDFARGAHIALMEDLTNAVALLPRRELRLQLRQHLDAELDP